MHSPNSSDFYRALNRINVSCDKTIAHKIMHVLNGMIFFPVKYALKSFEDAAHTSADLKVPALYHCATTSVETLVYVARE